MRTTRRTVLWAVLMLLVAVNRVNRIDGWRSDPVKVGPGVSVVQQVALLKTSGPQPGEPVVGALLYRLYVQGNWDDPGEPGVSGEFRTADDLDRLPSELSTDVRDEVARLVDGAAGDRVIVIGTYGDCEQHSQVVYGSDAGTVEFVVDYDDDDDVDDDDVDDDDDEHDDVVDCAWTPEVIDAWSVPIEAFDTD